MPRQGRRTNRPRRFGRPQGSRAGRKRSHRPASARQHPPPASRQDGVIHTAGNSPVPARRFSGRLLVLGLTMGAVTVLLAPNVHTFLQQRAEISALRDDIAAKEAQQSAYECELPAGTIRPTSSSRPGTG